MLRVAFAAPPAHGARTRPCTVRCCASRPPQGDANAGRCTRRAAAMAAAALVALSVSGDLPLPLVPPAPPPAEAVGIAPTPINPYAQRRARKTYQAYMQRVEKRLEELPLGNLKEVVESGGAGLTVSYRVAGLSAFIAAALSVLVVHPIDSVKTRLQAGTAGPQLFSGLYRGVFGNILKEAPAYAIYLGVYEAFKSTLMTTELTTLFRDLPLLTFLLAGALGDAVGSLTRVPAELVNKRLQLQLSANLPSAAVDVFATSSGRAALRQAWASVLMRDVPFGGLQIMLYEVGKAFVRSHSAIFPSFLPTSGLAADTVVGSLAGAFTALVTTPADVLVTRIALASSGDQARASVFDHLAAVWKKRGPAGLFAGAAQRAAYFLVLSALFFGLYEKTTLLASHPAAALHSVRALLSALGEHVDGAVQVLGPGVLLLQTEIWTTSSLLLFLNELPVIVNMITPKR